VRHSDLVKEIGQTCGLERHRKAGMPDLE
jgi:hypothetical protein